MDLNQDNDYESEGIANYNKGLNYRYGWGNTPINFENAFNYFKLAADAGIEKAKREIGTLYKYGLGVEQSYERAIPFLQEAADEGDVFAQEELAECYEEGLGVAKSPQIALKYYNFASQQGSAYSSGRLGYFYDYGKGTFKDLEQAFQYYKTAAKNGSFFSLWQLGEFHEKGLGGAHQSYENAANYFKMASEDDNQYALNKLGIYNECGLIDDCSLKAAFNYYFKSGKLRNSFGLLQCGRFLFLGLMGRKSKKHALSYFKKAAKLQIDQDIENLIGHQIQLDGQEIEHITNSIFEEGRKEVESVIQLDAGPPTQEFLPNTSESKKDLADSYWKIIIEKLSTEKDSKALLFHYCQCAAQCGHIQAIAYLGTLYELGIGTHISTEKALYCFNRAAEYFNCHALTKLGDYYENGTETPQSDKEALLYYISTARQNSAKALSELGSRFLKGNGVKQSNKAAFYLCKKAFDINKYCWFGFIDCLKETIPMEKGFLYLYAKYLRTAADTTEPLAQYYYGTLLEFGLGVEMSQEEAFQYYKASAEQDYIKGILAVARCYLFGIGVKPSQDLALTFFNMAANEDLKQEIQKLPQATLY